MKYVLAGYAKNISQVSDMFIYMLIYFNLLMLVLEHNALYVAFQKDPENGYHWNDLSGHLYAYSRRKVVC